MSTETFGINVEIKPGATVPTLKKVEDGLKATEGASGQAKKALTGLSATMHDVAAAAEQEARMFQMATGRTEQFGHQLLALRKLHETGRVSAEEYIKTLQKMGVEIDSTTHKVEAMVRAQVNAHQAMQTIAINPGGLAPKPGMGVKDLMGMGAAGLGAAGAAGAGIAAIDHVIETHHKMSDQYTELSNKAVKFTDDTKSTNDVIAEQVALGQELHTTAAKVIGVYDSVGDATERLNLSSSEQIRLTELLGKGAMLGGKSIDSIGERLNALSSAFETGADAGGQLRKLFRDFKDVGDDLSKTMGLSKAQIVDMASNGQISFEQLVDALLRGGGKIEESFAKVQKTHADATDQFQEGFNIALQSGEGFYNAMVAGAAQAEESFKTTEKVFGQMADSIARNMNRLKNQDRWTMGPSASDADFDAFGKAMGNNFDAGQFSTRGDATAAAKWKLFDDRRSNVSDAKTELAALEQLWKSVEHGGLTTDLYTAKKKQLQDVINGTVSAMHKENDALQKREELMRENYLRDNAYIRAQREKIDPGVTTFEGISPMTGVPLAPGMNDPKYAAKSAYEASLEFNEKTVTAAKDSSDQVKEAWASAAGEMSASFLKALSDTDAGWEQTTAKILQQIALIAAQTAAAQIGGPGGAFATSLLGGLFGGRHGFDYVANTNALQLPGFAYGGDMVARGGGGQDQQLAMFRVSAGESIHVRTPQQQEAARMAAMAGTQTQAAPQRVTNQIVVQSDPREVTRAMGSAAGQREFVNLNRKFRTR